MVDLAFLLFLAFPQETGDRSLRSNTLLDGDPVVSGAEAQIRPASVATGDAFDLEIEVWVKDGWDFHPTDTLGYLRGARARGPVEIEPDPRPGAGRRMVRLSYPLQGLRPGTLQLPPLRARIEPAPKATPVGGVPSSPQQESTAQGRWITLPLGQVEVVSVLPGPPDGLDPAGPLIPPPDVETRTGALSLLLGVVALVSGTGAWTLGRKGRPWTRSEGPVGSGASSSASRTSGPEARKRLRRILGHFPPPGQTPREGLDEAFSLFRIVVSHETEGATHASTSSELLASVGAGGGGDVASLRPLLMVSDRLRFGALRPSPEEVAEGLRGLEEWLEGSND